MHVYPLACRNFKDGEPMIELDIVRELAREFLMSFASSDGENGYLWDRTERLVHNAEHICRLPELSKADVRIDHFCLFSATYFSEAGVIYRPEKADWAGGSFNLPPNGDDALDWCREIVEKKLSPSVGHLRVRKINKIISESWSHSPRMTESMILSDARNLEDMGAIGVFREFRRFISEDKSISEVLKNWRKKIDYRYWQSRLKNSFRFEEVRKLAETRLSAAERFMEQLQVEKESRDLKELIVEQSEAN